MWPFEITRCVQDGVLTIRVQFLDCEEQIYNVFNDPDLVRELAYQYILGAIELDHHVTLANHLGWDFVAGLTMPSLYWLTRNGDMPNLLPYSFTSSEEAFALGSTLIQMAHAMCMKSQVMQKVAV